MPKNNITPKIIPVTVSITLLVSLLASPLKRHFTIKTIIEISATYQWLVKEWLIA